MAHPGKPPLALIARAGDPASGVAAAIVTDGIAPARSTTVAWSLATLLASRLPGASIVAASEGLRIRGRAHGAAEVTRFFTEVREALAAPVTANEAGAVARKLATTAPPPMRLPSSPPPAAGPRSRVPKLSTAPRWRAGDPRPTRSAG